MLTLQHSPAHRYSCRMPETKVRPKAPGELVPASHVKNLLHELAIQMHQTRVVGWKDGAMAPKKG